MPKVNRVGYDFLHNHTGMEKQLNVPQDHVIVDRQDWEEVVKFFNEHSETIAWLNEINSCRGNFSRGKNKLEVMAKKRDESLNKLVENYRT